MSGHSKWATIKRKKAKNDAVRGKLFTKFLREITTSAKLGGADPAGNPRLRLAIEKARENNVPSDNIKRAIDKGSGAGGAGDIFEINYEGYGPAGVAVLVEAITDNKNRTSSDIRSIFTRHGGNLGAAGCVGWMFKKKGMLSFDKKNIDEDALSMEAIEAGAEDIEAAENSLEITTTPEDFEKVRNALKDKGFNPSHSEIAMVPENQIKVQGEDAEKVLKLIQALEDYDDVQNVYANFDISEEELRKLA